MFGFLGPNGAGKTTTIRCLLGLVRPTAGRCRLLGAEPGRDLARVIGRVGSIVETPTLFPRFSGRRNLRLLGRLNGIGPKRVDEVLERVGLGPRAGHQVRTYSLGMKQRLGVAAALLKDPEVLILDEPANGLDPAGIVEIRELLRSLGAEGRTVFVSSHQLAEVQQVCDRVAILSRGRAVAAGAVSDVLAMSRSRGMVLRLADLPAGVSALREAGIESSIHGDAIRVAIHPNEGPRVSEALARRALYLSELRPEEISLETVFLELTQEARDPDGSGSSEPPGPGAGSGEAGG